MWPPFCLTTSCKRTLASLSRYYTLCFCIKQYNFHLLIYSQPPVVRQFTNWWHLSHFPWTTAFTPTFATSILWCYNFNGMIKWYDISCATLYLVLTITQRYNSINVNWSLCKVPAICQILMKIESSRQTFEKYSNNKLHENPSSGSRVVPCLTYGTWNNSK